MTATLFKTTSSQHMRPYFFHFLFLILPLSSFLFSLIFFLIPLIYLWKKIMGDKLLILLWNVEKLHETKDEEVSGHHVEPHQDHRAHQSLI